MIALHTEPVQPEYHYWTVVYWGIRVNERHAVHHVCTNERTKTLPKTEVLPGFEPGFREDVVIKIPSDNHYTIVPYVPFILAFIHHESLSLKRRARYQTSVRVAHSDSDHSCLPTTIKRPRMLQHMSLTAWRHHNHSQARPASDASAPTAPWKLTKAGALNVRLLARIRPPATASKACNRPVSKPDQ